MRIYLHNYYHKRYGSIWKNLPIAKELQLLLETTVTFFESFPEKELLSVEEFELYFFANTVIKDKDIDLYKKILNDLRTIELDEAIVSQTLSSIKTRAIAGELSIASFGLAEGSKSLEDIHRIYERFDHVQEGVEEKESFVTDDLETLYEETIKSPGLRWRLGTLNRMLGSLRKGDFGFIFARPETGKTTLLASEVTYFAEQTDRPILWLNNEEGGNKVKIRCYQAALGVQLHELMSDRAGNRQRYQDITSGNIRLFDSASIHKKQVEELCRVLQPALIVIDQIDKIKGFEEDREDLRLGDIYIWARELAKEYCPIIGICQAGATAEGKKYLTMDDVANAKTSKQAEADFIIGVGKTHDVDLEYVRHINICKNKLAGDTDTIPELRHGRADVIIKPEIARYVDIL